VQEIPEKLDPGIQPRRKGTRQCFVGIGLDYRTGSCRGAGGADALSSDGTTRRAHGR